ncbi:hypothetical protein [Actinotalea sp.]|uniref:hypothetical protein n=1 Tax=Actinotalea sp. TaxID=1872145 RepID=UPI002BA62F4F|nr:hypothetical protein [Actinotalea sp.]HQY33140.1 hypothetical protein [Actinotalea sp.]HRA50048.1 hypothetical protein [Actinotalea sp.]
MTWSELTVLVSALLLLVAWFAWVAASRLDRLHRKVATSWTSLDDQLVRRASSAAELASGGLLDPVSSVLVGEAAWVALSSRGTGREAGPTGPTATVLPSGTASTEGTARDVAESELSRTIRVALSDPADVEALRAVPAGDELVEALAAAWYRVQLSRRFHNEAVAQTQRMRRKWAVRLLRLYGHAPIPQTVEIDDAWPEALGTAGGR